MAEPIAFVLTHESDPKRVTNGLSIQALAITRSLGRRGVTVVRLHPNRLETSLLSRYCSSVEICPNVHGQEAELVAFLLALAERHAGPRVLIPASDDAAFFLGTHRDALIGSFRVPAPSRAIIERIIDKRLQYGEAERLGIPIPETYFPKSLDEVRGLAGRLSHYPYVIKPNVAHRWRMAEVKKDLSSTKGRPQKGVVARSERELVAEYEAIARHDSDLMIQEVIGGRDELLYTFLAYFDEESKPLGYCVRSKLRQYPLDFGYCTLTVTCENPVVADQSIRLLQGLRFHGIVGVEWKHDPRTDRYKLIEINARAVNTIGIAPACGVDVPYIAFADSIGEKVDPVTRWKSGVKWLWITQDLWAARELVRAGRLTWGGWWRSVSGPRVHAILARDDMRPFRDYLTQFVRQRLNRRRSGRKPARAL
jgi:predicted ATP-grasp superfamily ATP-dependent carboligase